MYKYLELKNKLSEFVLGLVSKSGEITLALVDKLKANMVAFFGFAATAFLGNLISGTPAPLTSIFTRDVTRLAYSVLVGSLVYMCIGVLEMAYGMRKIDEGYGALKDSYRELLDERDMAEMFGEDAVLERNMSEARKWRHVICAVWILALIAAFLVIDSLSAAPVIPWLVRILGSK